MTLWSNAGVLHLSRSEIIARDRALAPNFNRVRSHNVQDFNPSPEG